jgi:hypothetical protein
MTATMCERRGDVERKVRSDRGKDRSSSERNKRSPGESNSPSSSSNPATTSQSTDVIGRPSKRPHRTDDASPSAVTGVLPAVDPDLLGHAAMGSAVL